MSIALNRLRPLAKLVASRLSRLCLTALAPGLFLTACPPPSPPSSAPSALNAGGGVVIRHDYGVPLTVRPSRDSLWAVEQAAGMFRNNGEAGPFVVTTFVSDHDGFLVRLALADPNVIGGGGLAWIDRTGTVVILHRYQ